MLVGDERSRVDLALLQISDPLFDEHLPLVNFARIDRDSPAPVPDCWAVGFPRFGEAGPVLAEGSRKETWEVRGVILPGHEAASSAAFPAGDQQPVGLADRLRVGGHVRVSCVHYRSGPG